MYIKMKKSNLLAYLSIVLFSVAILSCKKDGDDNSDDDGGNDNGLKTGQIEIKGYANEKDKKISFSATAKTITINWGDGKIDEVTPNGVAKSFSHEYVSSSDFQTILINAEDLTGIDFSSYPHSIHEFRLGNCPKLQRLILEERYTTPYFDTSSNYRGPANLTVLEINKAESLTTLNVRKTKLTSLNLGGCTALTSLNCSYNQLTSLDVSKCTALTELDCSGNQFTTLDVNSTSLTALDCSFNELASLNVSKCTKLTSLRCRENQLTALDVSKCTALNSLQCSYNQLSASALNSLFNSLPAGKKWQDGYYERTSTINIYDNPGTNSCNKSIAENKGWEVH
jgi:hypothetical protein